MARRAQGSLAEAHARGRPREDRPGARGPAEAAVVTARPAVMADGGGTGGAAGAERLGRYLGGRIRKARK